MRPSVSSSIILAAVALTGALAAGASTRPVTGRSASGASRPSSVHVRGLSVAELTAAGLPPSPPARALLPGAGADLPPSLPEAREFFFTRAVYTSGARGWGRRSRAWRTDYPKADRQFTTVLSRLVDIDVYPGDHAVALDDPELRRFPFLYMLEVGDISLTPAEVHGLRSYLEAGGFLVVDDFWGLRAWDNFERQMREVLPGRPIVDLPLDHPIFSAFYDIDEILQVPNVGNGRTGNPAWYTECRGCMPAVRGILDEDGRLMVVINWNTDLGDAWEWAEDPYYPLDRSTFACQMGANMIVYAMSH